MDVGLFFFLRIIVHSEQAPKGNVGGTRLRSSFFKH
jgi:hypothetical protein